MSFFQPITTAKNLISIGALLICTLVVPTAWSDEASPTATGDNPVTNKLHRLGNRASELAMEAMGLLGIEYKYGGDTPETGLDCSGFVHYIFAEAWGKILPRTARGLSREGEHIDKKHLQAGDLVFFNTLKRKFSHVGIYLGDNKFIHAPSTGNVVRIESMDVSYWKKRFNGGRRISASEQ